MLGFSAVSEYPVSAIPPLWVEFTQTYQQGFRVADTSLALYELYVGEGTPPDFEASGQPVQTSATLPFSWTPTPPVAGTLTLYCVVRQRNAYNLDSFNVFETQLIIDTAGDEVVAAPSDPKGVSGYDGASGYINVVAKYVKTDDSSPADKWEIYVGEGVDPVPGTDTPVYTGDMDFIGDEAGIAETVGPYTPGVVLHVIVTALRDSDSNRGNATVVQQTLALALDITGDLFGGSAYEQR